MSGAPSVGTVKVLFAWSRNVCAYSDPTTGVGCEEKLTDPAWAAVRAHICHIAGRRVGSARYDPTMTDEERNGYDNLMLLCPNHHNLVDDLEPARFPADVLRAMKTRHEERSATATVWTLDVYLERYAALAVAHYVRTHLGLSDATRGFRPDFSDEIGEEQSQALFGSRSRGTVLSAIAALPDDGFSSGDLTRVTGLPSSVVSRELRRLEAAGLVQTIGEGRATRVRIWQRRDSALWTTAQSHIVPSSTEGGGSSPSSDS